MDEKYGTRIRKLKLRSDVPYKFQGMTFKKLHALDNRDLCLKDHTHLYVTIYCIIGMADEHNFMTSDIVTTDLPQYHVSKGLQIYGQKGIETVLKELKQLHNQINGHRSQTT